MTGRGIAAGWLAIATGAGLLFVAAPGAGAQETTPTEPAYTEIAECLGGRDRLAVSFAVDESLSLEDNDKDAVRAELLATAVESLGRLVDEGGKQVDVAVSTFASEYNQDRDGERLLDWRPLGGSSTADTAEDIRQEITNDNLKEFTNHPAALAGIRRDIAAAPSTEGSLPCRVSIFFTDGQLDVADGADEDQANTDAATQMCAPAGIVDQVRRDQINLITVGLFEDPNDPTTQEGRNLLQSMAEGAGQPPCGQVPIPSGYSHGAYEEGGVEALSIAISRIINTSAGGTCRNFAGSPVNFQVDPGIADLGIDGMAPQGVEVGPPSGASVSLRPGEVSDVSGTSVSWTSNAFDMRFPAGSDGVGEWIVTRPGQTDNATVCYFTGLGLQPDSDVRLLAGEASALTGKVVRVDGSGPVDLNIYGGKQLAVVSEDGTVGQVELAADGAFSFPFTAESGLTAADLNFEMQLTTTGGFALDPIRAAMAVPVSLPDDFPTVRPARLSLTTLEGEEGVATGTIHLTGSSKGTTSACIGPMVWDEPARSDRYAGSVDGEAEKCFTLDPGQDQDVPIQVTTNEAADETVAAVLPVALTGAEVDGPAAETESDVPVGFSATRPVNSAATYGSWGLFVVLILVLHVLALWGVGQILSTFRPPGTPVSRGTIPVMVGTTGQVPFITVPPDKPKSSAAPLFKGKEFVGPDTSRFAAKAPPLWFPFRSPRGEIEPPAGTRVFSNFGDFTHDGGRTAPVGLSIGSLVYVTVAESDLLSGKREVPGRLSFIFSGNDARVDVPTTANRKLLDIQSRLGRTIGLMKQSAMADAASSADVGSGPVSEPHPGPDGGERPLGPGGTGSGGRPAGPKPSEGSQRPSAPGSSPRPSSYPPPAAPPTDRPPPPPGTRPPGPSRPRPPGPS